MGIIEPQPTVTKKPINNHPVNFQSVIVCVFLLILILPIFQQSFDLIPIKVLNENRTKATEPKLNLPALVTGDFSEQFNSYYTDHFGFRDTLVRTSKNIDYHIFNTSSTENVIIGKKGWFYYTPEIMDYMRISSLTDNQIDDISSRFLDLQQTLKERHTNFLLVIPPNKSSIYPEYVSDNIRRTPGPSNCELLKKALKIKGVNFIELEPDLVSSKRLFKQAIYFNRDTHWNYEGAMIAAKTMLNYISTNRKTPVQMPSIEGYKKTKVFADLNLMMALDSTPYYNEPIFKKNGRKQLGKAIWFGDSFSTALVPIMQPYFSDFIYVKHSDYISDPSLLTDIDTKDTDLVVYEIVERSLPGLVYMNLPTDIFKK